MLTTVADSAILTAMAITDYIGTTEAAERCGVDRTTFFRWVQLGQITPAMKLPGATGAMLFNPDEVAALAETKRATKAAS